MGGGFVMAGAGDTTRPTPTSLRDKAAMVGHAPEGTQVSVVYVTAAALVVLILLSMLGVWLMMRIVSSLLPPNVGSSSSQTWQMAAPERATGMPSAGQVLAHLRQRDALILSTYGWVDEQAGVAQIPIERAMEILAHDRSLLGEINQNAASNEPAQSGSRGEQGGGGQSGGGQSGAGQSGGERSGGEQEGP